MSQVVYLGIFVDVETVDEAFDAVTEWLTELPTEHSGHSKGFERMLMTDHPVAAEDFAPYDPQGYTNESDN